MIIKRLLIIVFVVAAAVIFYKAAKTPMSIHHKNVPISVQEGDKKRPPNILLFMCNYGAGHKMAAQGIQEALPDCHIRVVDIYNEPLRQLDLLQAIFPAMSCDKIYNEMAKNEYNRSLNLLGQITPNVLLWQRQKVEELLLNYIALQKPDMLISCVPLVDSMLLSVAQKLHIPLLVVTTDIDISFFCYGFEKQDLTMDKGQFRISVPYDEKNWGEKFRDLCPKKLHPFFQYNFGYPTRKAFSEPVDQAVLQELRKEYEILPDENLILVMMGGNTAQAAKVYAKLLLGMSEDQIGQIVADSGRKKIHLLCLCGNISESANRALMRELNQLNESSLRRNNLVRIHATGGTQKIAQIASLEELCTVISKPGGSTVNEMIKKRIPMVYHLPDVPFTWEKGNMEYGKMRHFGLPFQAGVRVDVEARGRLVAILKKTFEQHKTLQSDPNVFEANIDFAQQLGTSVQEMLSGK